MADIKYSSKAQAENGTDNTTTMTPLRVKQSILANSPEAPAQQQADWNESDNTKTSYIKNKPNIPSKTSDLTNDSNFVADASYVHTDNNYTTTEKNKLSGIADGAQVNVIETIKVNNTAQTVTSKAVNITVPTKTSDLTNDDNVVKDASYVHTDNNYTTTEKNKLSGIAAGAEVNVQSDWNQATTTADDYIKNKPTIPIVNDATLTIKRSGVELVKFTANSATDKTADIEVPVYLSDLTNDLGFIETLQADTQADAIDLNTIPEGTYCTDGWIKVGNSSNSYSTRHIAVSGWHDDIREVYYLDQNCYGTIFREGTSPNYTYDYEERYYAFNDEIFSGDYNDLYNTPSIPTATSDLTNDSGFITSSQLPTVNNATLTIQKNGTNVQTFTANQSTNVTANITVPTKTSDLTNDSNFITNTGSTSGNAGTATTLQNSRTIGIGTGATGTATSFNGSANITIPITDVKEAYSVWGGKSLSNNLSPSDMGCIDEFGHNKLAYLPAGCIKAEYTTDGGTTWVDYGLTDNEKIALTTTTGQSVIIGNGTANAKNGTMTTSNMGNFKARVTISTRVFGETYGSLYTAAKKWLINISNEGATCKCLVEEKTIANYNNNVDTWTTVGTYDVAGWSGWNSIPYIKSFGGSPTQTTQIAAIRFTLYNSAINTAYNCTSRFLDIRLIGASNWTTPSEMSRTGHLYKYANDKKATFPNSILPETNNSFALGGTSLKWANVYATTFNGDLTGTATKATGDKNGNDITTTYQPTLVSGTNIKTINNASILGSGNITIGGGGTSTDVQVNGTSITSGGVANLVTETAYDESTNKIATINDLPTMPSLTNYVKNTDYATSSTGGVVKINGYGLQVSSGTLIGLGKSYADYNNAANQLIVSKQTLENVISGKNLATTSAIPTKTSDLTNDGSDGSHPFINNYSDNLEGLGINNSRLSWLTGAGLVNTDVANLSDVPTKLSDFATTLYNDVSGTFGNITLKKDGVNESSANYECLEIEYSNNSNNVPHKTVRLYSPNGNNADLSSEYDNGTNLFIYSESISISGATITRGTQTRWRIATSGNAQRSTANCIYIYKVVGYK